LLQWFVGKHVEVVIKEVDAAAVPNGASGSKPPLSF
jgi:hypothetical protein